MLEALADEDAAACMMLGEVYYYGEGVDSDLDRATMVRTRRAGDLPEAWTFLGTMAFYGEGRNKDAKLAERLYRQAAERDEPQACTTSWLLEERGEETLALEYLERAAGLGHAPSACLLAERCLEAEPPQFDRAVEWLGARRGRRDPDALFMRAEMLRDGVGGVPTCARRWSCSIWRRSRDAIRAWSGVFAAGGCAECEGWGDYAAPPPHLPSPHNTPPTVELCYVRKRVGSVIRRVRRRFRRRTRL
ncbi:MAG: hypothetical protein R3E96_12740 [Planctomycetota bacterium]